MMLSTLMRQRFKLKCIDVRCYKRGKNPRYKPKPKHPLNVHVWAVISYRGCTILCIFEGKINTPLFIQILRCSLLPFIKSVYPDGHCFVQDNDPKHCSQLARQFLGAPQAAPILFSFRLPVCNARPIYIYIYNMHSYA